MPAFSVLRVEKAETYHTIALAIPRPDKVGADLRFDGLMTQRGQWQTHSYRHAIP